MTVPTPQRRKKNTDRRKNTENSLDKLPSMGLYGVISQFGIIFIKLTSVVNC